MLSGLELVGGNRVFSDTLWHNFIPAISIDYCVLAWWTIEVVPRRWKARRQAIHRLDFLVLLHQGKRTKLFFQRYSENCKGHIFKKL